jgi:hypothetical protein
MRAITAGSCSGRKSLARAWASRAKGTCGASGERGDPWGLTLVCVMVWATTGAAGAEEDVVAAGSCRAALGGDL